MDLISSDSAADFLVCQTYNTHISKNNKSYNQSIIIIIIIKQ